MKDKNKMIEDFVADMRANGTSDSRIGVYMNQPAMDRRGWYGMKRLIASSRDSFRGFNQPLYSGAFAMAVDELGNAFVLGRNGDRRQFLKGEQIKEMM